MAKVKKEFPIAISHTGLHICIDDILTPTETLGYIKQLQNALWEWHKLTGNKLDEGKPK